MYQVNLPYCRMMGTVNETPFGVPELDNPKVYDNPIPNKVILKVDLLELLKDRFDEPCFICRDIMYALFSGSHGFYDCNQIFYSYYKKFPSFRRIINDAYYYGDDSIPLFERVVLPIREELNKYMYYVITGLKDSGGKYLVSTHDYVYFAFKEGNYIPDKFGGIRIC